MKKLQYCSIDPKFPDNGYILFLFIFSEEGVIGLTPLSSVFETTNEAAVAMEALTKESEQYKSVAVPPECIIIPVKFHSLYPLERRYWESPSLHYDTWDRMKLFLPLAKNPTLYHLLVTPSYIEDSGETLLHATLPLSSPDDKELIEKFMLTSDQVVDERAKSSAIYSVGEAMKFNWLTAEMTKVEKYIDEKIN